MTRTDQILRALWDRTQGGTLAVSWPRLLDKLDFTPTADDIDAVLDTGLVVQIPGGGGPCKYRMTVTLDDLLDFEHGEFYDADIEQLVGAL